MCAHVLSARSSGVQRSFCEHGGLGKPCRWASNITCTDDTYDADYHGTTGTFPWYQAAIYWAQQHGFRYVYFDWGAITITATSKIPAWTPGGIPWAGIHVPSHMQVRGYDAYLVLPTVITTSQAKGSLLLGEVIVVADTAQRVRDQPVVDASVSNFVITGNGGNGADCPSDGLTMSSINDMDTHTPTWTDVNLNTIAAGAGVAVDGADGTQGVVNLDHLKIAHVGSGIALGWRAPFTPANPACVSNSCLRLQLSPATCTGQVVSSSQASGCTTNYCLIKSYPFLGAPTYNADVSNDSICDVANGLALVGGYVNIHHNMMLGGQILITNTAGVIPDGTSINFYENYLRGFGLGVETDGSPYSIVDDAMFQAVTGVDPATCPTWQDRLNKAQYIFDDASRFFLGTDPYLGFGQYLTVRDNRIYNSSVGGVNLYRQNWDWVGWNVIRNAPFAVGLVNAINSWVFGNSIQSMTNYGVEIAGSPGVQSQLGSCYDGIDVYCDTYGCPGGFVSPNAYTSVSCPVHREAGYCSDPQTPPSGCASQ